MSTTFPPGPVTPEMEDQGAPIPAGPRARRWLAPGARFAALWAAALPLTAETAFIRLLQVADLFWLGRIGPAAMAAVAVGISLRWGFSSLAMGLGVGGMATVARRAAEHDEKGASLAAWQTITLCLVVTAVLVGAGLALAGPLLGLVGVGDEVRPLGLSYLRISLVGLIPMLLVYSINALWRGVGQPARAIAVQGLTTGLSLALEPILVLGWGIVPRLGVAGSAVAIALGQTLGLGVHLVLLVRGTGRLRLRRDTLILSPPLAHRILSVAGANTPQMILRALSRIVLIGIVGWFGTAAVAGYAAANSILMLILIPSHALGNAAATLVMRSLGTGQVERALRGVWLTGAANVAYTLGAVAALFSIAPRAIALFNADPAVVAQGADALRIVSLGYISSSLGTIMARGMDRTGGAMPVAEINVLTLWGIQIPIALLLSHFLGATGVWLGLAIGGVANGLLVSHRFRRGEWNLGARG